MHDEEIARSLNFQEMIRSQQEEQQRNQNNEDGGVSKSEALPSTSRAVLKFEEVGYKIKMIKDPSLKKSNMF
jgi:hypothetical protein